MRKRKSLSELVEEQNRLAEPRPERPDGETVRVLVEAVYNGPDHRSIGRCAVGSIVTVAGGWYVTELIQNGMVTRDLGIADEAPESEEPFAEPVETPAEETPAAKPKRKRKE